MITPDDNSLVLCAESRREMEDWLSALKAASFSASASASSSLPSAPGGQTYSINSNNSSTATFGSNTRSGTRNADTEFFDGGTGDQHDFLCNHHHWYATSHIRPTYCNVCRDALSGVTSHGLACEVCKSKVHKRCAAKSIANCKWTTLASVGREIIEDQDGNILMPHQWHEGNLPVASSCAVCKKTCGSVLRLVGFIPIL